MTYPMIERVAKAMRAESGGKPFSWENAARAAIEAMREPTDEMLSVGYEATWEPSSDRSYIEESTLHDVWRAMIDAVLK